MKTEELCTVCPKCSCKDKHIIRSDDHSGPIIGIEYKNTGCRAPEGSKFRCSECGYIFG